MELRTILYIIGVIVVTALIFAIRFVALSHILGTFKFDNSGETYRCLMEFENLDDIEKRKFAIVRIKEADLSLPGEHKATNRKVGSSFNEV